MTAHIPAQIIDALTLAHPSWHPTLEKGLRELTLADPAYLPALAAGSYLPTQGRLFAAFRLPFDAVRYILVGEGPYPREASATGVCFMDGAVEALWSANGLSKQVNRATSLRNFMKMLLVADGWLSESDTGAAALQGVARRSSQDDSCIQGLPELQANLISHGFLLLNASLVFRADVAPVKDARAWRPFLKVVLESLAARERPATPTLVLWGKIAEQLASLDVTGRFPTVRSEHPYNLSFIANKTMQDLFGPMRLLRKPSSSRV
ncbi:uracil-DNA glycosylase [Noviherbaspirillum aridicola]|uniref:Uracil-DNA glycosylase n=1 Tax=Noviherbaspirillum aridicola TaxID=2849687 RepID=A0ABQ4Q9X8_9BURK|nr:uracil-DNA glycosylase [Noviherbaspirillum aridicola]GIZ53575.1 uracil-DNA glycosylase [Noviherbaspirillum aridicola]